MTTLTREKIQDGIIDPAADRKSVLKPYMMSHGTLESRELEKSRQFYEQCLGLDAIRTSPRSLMIRLGGENTIEPA